jgi:hypothetical protein
MSTTQQDKPGGKSRQRNRKPDARGQKRLDQSGADQINAAAVLAASEPSAPAPLILEAARAESTSLVPVAPAENGSIGIQTFAKAYGNYSWKLFQQTGCLVERLMGVRSFDKAIEVQSEFARQSFANLVVESQNIGELYAGLARQFFQYWERSLWKASR